MPDARPEQTRIAWPQLADEQIALVLDDCEDLVEALFGVVEDDVPGHIILTFVENNPGEQPIALDHKTHALIRELEQRERDVRRAMVRSRRSREPSRASAADVPF